MKKIKKIAITSGYFNPMHVGHINLFREAKKIGDALVVIVNNDEQVKLKGSVPFMTENERLEVIKDIKHVDDVFLSIDSYREGSHVPISKSLEAISLKYPDAELFFAKGGDRNSDNIPESESKICGQLGIKVVNGVGGGKVQSSSWLIKKSRETA